MKAVALCSLYLMIFNPSNADAFCAGNEEQTKKLHVFVQKIQTIVKEKDFAKLANHVKFPFKVKDGHIQTKKEFSEKAKHYFTDIICKKILMATPANSVCNWQGLGLYHGTLWMRDSDHSMTKIEEIKLVTLN